MTSPRWSLRGGTRRGRRPVHLGFRAPRDRHAYRLAMTYLHRHCEEGFDEAIPRRSQKDVKAPYDRRECGSSAEVFLQELDSALARALRRIGVVRAALVAVEAVARSGVEVMDL